MSEQHADVDIPETVAAVDLGSNSFHMIVGKLDNEQVVIVDRLRDAVRLGGGLRDDKTLSDDAWERALDSLSRMGQRLRALPQHAVRAVGTNTMRQIRDGGAFLQAAEDALGHPIEIIGGREEARLVYLGVAHGLAPGDETRLVIDIGGGSTELILGEGLTARERESLFMGCVSMTRRFFPNGRISQDAMDRAVLSGRVELRPVRRIIDARIVHEVHFIANGWSEEGINRSSLKRLRRALVSAGHIDEVKFEELSDDRRPVFAGGVAVLSAVFKALDIDAMQVSDLALREGLLYELVGHIRHIDIRDSTVRAVMQRFGVDRKQASRVEATARALLRQVEQDGAYILANADLPGFSRPQQAVLAALVRVHRRRFLDSEFVALPTYAAESTKRMAVLLRLSALMHRGRSGSHKPPMKIAVHEKDIRLDFPEGWLLEHPLTEAEIAREAEYLSASGFTLQYA